jgi:hypothetical protein
MFLRDGAGAKCNEHALHLKTGFGVQMWKSNHKKRPKLIKFVKLVGYAPMASLTNGAQGR